MGHGQDQVKPKNGSRGSFFASDMGKLDTENFKNNLMKLVRCDVVIRDS